MPAGRGGSIDSRGCAVLSGFFFFWLASIVLYHLLGPREGVSRVETEIYQPVPSHSCDDVLVHFLSSPLLEDMLPPALLGPLAQKYGSRSTGSFPREKLPPFSLPASLVLGLSCHVISTSCQGPGASSRVAGAALPECVTAGIRDTGSAGCGAPAGRRKGSPRAAAGTYSREVASLRISTRQAKDPSLPIRPSGMSKGWLSAGLLKKCVCSPKTKR
jgi:hypothetical protein